MPNDVVYIPNAARVLMNLCSISIPIFFLSSGYCTLYSEHNTWRKVFRKVGMIIILAVFWNILTPFPYWFFITLSMLYLATPLMRHMLRLYPWLYWFCILAIAVATFGKNEIIVMARHLDIAPLDTMWVSGLMTSYAFVYYAIGERMRRKTFPIYLSCILFMSGLIISVVDGSILTISEGAMFDGVNAAFCMLSALLMSTGAFSLLIRIRYIPFQSIVETAAKGCLAVYIFHSSMISLLRNTGIVQSINSLYPIYQISLYIILSILIYLACWCAGRLILSIPFIRMLMKL